MVVDKVVCERVWLTKMGGGGGSGGGGGIQNQKQEPHTKMWGKKHLIWEDEYGSRGRISLGNKKTFYKSWESCRSSPKAEIM